MKKLTKKHREKLSIAHNGLSWGKHTEEYKQKMSNSMKGMKNHMYGKTHTKKWKMEMSEKIKKISPRSLNNNCGG